jgi:nitrogen-specific signal transduction histidine kinase
MDTEHAPLPMATVDGATHVVRYANPAFCRLMNQSLEELVDTPLDELLPAKDQCIALVERVSRTRAPEPIRSGMLANLIPSSGPLRSGQCPPPKGSWV